MTARSTSKTFDKAIRSNTRVLTQGNSHLVVSLIMSTFWTSLVNLCSFVILLYNINWLRCVFLTLDLYDFLANLIATLRTFEAMWRLIHK